MKWESVNFSDAIFGMTKKSVRFLYFQRKNVDWFFCAKISANFIEITVESHYYPNFQKFHNFFFTFSCSNDMEIKDIPNLDETGSIDALRVAKKEMEIRQTIRENYRNFLIRTAKSVFQMQTCAKLIKSFFLCWLCLFLRVSLIYLRVCLCVHFIWFIIRKNKKLFPLFFFVSIKTLLYYWNTKCEKKVVHTKKLWDDQKTSE